MNPLAWLVTLLLWGLGCVSVNSRMESYDVPHRTRTYVRIGLSVVTICILVIYLIDRL